VRTASLVSVVAVACLVPAYAGEDVSGAQKALVSSLRDLGKGAWIASGHATEEDSAAASAGGAVVVAGAGEAAPFTGTFEAQRTANGDLVVASKSALPGVAIFQREERVLVSTTHEDTPIGTGHFANDLSSLLDFDRLARYVEKASLKSATNPDTKETTIEGELPAKAIKPSSGGGIAMIEPKVLRVTVHFVLDEKSKLRSARFGVVRSDPLANIRGRATAGGVHEGTVTLTPDSLGSDDEGKTTVYELTMAIGAPSPRTADALAAFQKLLAEQAH
jgi:hypothetical protein